MKYGPYSGTVVSLHDGDTMKLNLGISKDLGFGIKLDAMLVLSCRVYGINAPELSTPEGKVALAYAQTLVHVGDIVTVYSHGWDKYGGRFDGDVVLSDGSNFATMMLESGNAVPFQP